MQIARFLLPVLLVATLIPLTQAAAGSPVRVRINTSHGVENARGAVKDAGLSVATDVIVTTSSEFNGRPYLPPDKFMQDAQSVHATIMSSSFSGWDYLFDTQLYKQLTENDLVQVYAYVPRKDQPSNAPPPAAFATVNLIGGKTGGGIEFGIPRGYMNSHGQSDTPSGVTAQLAGLMASLKYNHPDWNWFDVKAALRTTASNFPTGYNPGKSGYGAIDYQAANALTASSHFPLFPPAAVMRTARNNTVIFAINSFKQNRRVADALFKFRMRPFPMLKDLTLAELTALGGKLLFTGDRSETTNSLTVQLASNEMTFFVWLSKDSNGLYSRIEPYSILGPLFFIPGKTSIVIDPK
ncbi:MAG: hypothetical protein PHF56_00015 [Desulfuromonadaceae bacterium]|nr:hypothetical protein [Desulfuromonadaceae bacterium]